MEGWKSDYDVVVVVVVVEEEEEEEEEAKAAAVVVKVLSVTIITIMVMIISTVQFRTTEFLRWWQKATRNKHTSSNSDGITKYQLYDSVWLWRHITTTYITDGVRDEN